MCLLEKPAAYYTGSDIATFSVIYEYTKKISKAHAALFLEKIKDNTLYIY